MNCLSHNPSSRSPLSTLTRRKQDESIQFYWDIIARDTIAEGARLHFRIVPAEFQCMACFQVYKPDGEDFSCPNCGAVGVKIIAGEEFALEAIDVE